jgi:hypothetical protein
MPEWQMDRLLQRNDTLLRDATGRFGDNLEFLKRLDRKATIHISEHMGCVGTEIVTRFAYRFTAEVQSTQS